MRQYGTSRVTIYFLKSPDHIRYDDDVDDGEDEDHYENDNTIRHLEGDHIFSKESGPH